MAKYIISTSGNEIEIARLVSLLGLPTEVKDWIEAHKEPLFLLQKERLIKTSPFFLFKRI